MALLTDNHSGLFGIVTEDQHRRINFYAMGFVQQDQGLQGVIYRLLLSKSTPVHADKSQKYLVREVADEEHLDQIVAHANRLGFDIYESALYGLEDDQLREGVLGYKKALLRANALSLEAMRERWKSVKQVPYETSARYAELRAVKDIRYAYTARGMGLLDDDEFVGRLAQMYMDPDYGRKQFLRLLGEALRIDADPMRPSLEDAAEHYTYEQWDAFSKSSALLVSRIDEQL